jgi:hypothetical protein
VPLPENRDVDLTAIHASSDIDALAFQQFGLEEPKSTLIEDMVNCTMPPFLDDDHSFGARGTTHGEVDDLVAYCSVFLEVLSSTIGSRVEFGAAVLVDAIGPALPVRMVAFHLDGSPLRGEVQLEVLNNDSLRERLRTVLTGRDSQPVASTGHATIAFQQIARVYTLMEHAGEKIPTLFIIKPDRMRFWTRSVALRDADDVVAESGLWNIEQPDVPVTLSKVATR